MVEWAINNTCLGGVIVPSTSNNKHISFINIFKLYYKIFSDIESTRFLQLLF